MRHRNFRHYLRKTASDEVLKQAWRSVFPGNDDHRSLKSYLNSKYKGNYLSDELIAEFENYLDQYEAIKVGG